MPYFVHENHKLIETMKRSRIIVLGVVFLSALAFASCGSRATKESADVEKKDTTAACCEKTDSTQTEMNMENAKDTTKTE